MDSCCGQGPTQGCRCYTDAEEVANAVRSFVRRRVAHAQDADDITQETLLRLYRSVEQLRDVGAFYGWMYRIARNAITDHHRRRDSRPVPVDPEDMDPMLGGSAVEDEPADELLSGCLRTLLGRVPDSYRAALELTDLGGLTHEAAADRLGLSRSGMKSRVQRGRRLLRAEITHCCEVSLDARGGLADVTVRSDESPCLPVV
ncbi:sigma-70 family RNA polymerase sigma factor [Nocardioides bigeumensis]|uniref:RNA polymerase sigma factor SigZ n=1 Tax=Nocardioides bigeumensis TaxID=433657 RepID=A0ABP5J9H0_9ACTN